MKKRGFTIILVIAMVFCITSASAYEVVESQDKVIQRQIDAVIMSVDVDALKLDATESIVDYSVPLSVRESVGFSAEITCDDPTYINDYDLKVGSTVQKVGEIDYGNGEIAPMYVAVSSAEVETKVDNGYNTKFGAKAWTFVYWIDNLGPSNELDSVYAMWDTSNCSYNTSNKIVKYGTSDPTGLVLLDYTTVSVDDDDDSISIECQGEYTGLTLACISEMDVGLSPVKLICRVHSGIFT